MVSEVKASTARSKSTVKKAVKTTSKTNSKIDATATAAKVAKKVAAAKPAPVKTPAKKSSPAPKAEPKVADKVIKHTRKTKIPKPIGITAEARLRHIEVAAYYIAEHRGFSGGDAADDWLAAEQQIDHLLLAGKLTG